MDHAQTSESQFMGGQNRAVPRDPTAVASDSDCDATFLVNIQDSDVAPYTVCLPYRLCRPGSSDLQEILRRVRKAHPRSASLAPTLKPFTFESALWTPRNICSLPTNNYILLAETGTIYRTPAVLLLRLPLSPDWTLLQPARYLMRDV